MKSYYTKEYIESTTGISFEEFLNVVKKYADLQNINFEIIKHNILTGIAVETALREIAQNNELYSQIEPAATEEEKETQQDPVNDPLTIEQPAPLLIEQVTQTQSQQATHSQTSYDTYEAASSSAFERPMVDSYALSQKIGVVFQSGNAISATDLSYNSPSIQTTDASETPSAIIIEIPNIEPHARYDIFFGDVNTSISGNLIADNGYGADNDADGSILNTIAGTFTTDQGGVVIVLENGDFTYTPASGYAGVDTFSYNVKDSNGATDTAEVTLALTVGDTATIVDFSNATITGYGGSSQNISDLHFVEDNGDTLQVAGNTWKDIALNYTVTADTIIEFDFMSTSIGEIHGIGFDTNDSISSNYTFKLFGTQSWGLSDFNTYAGNEGEWVHYTINVGDFYTGDFNRLFFTMDDDASASASANSFFSNITIYDPGTDASETVTGTSSSQSLFGNGGDDVIYGLDGDDVLYGGSGIDFLYGGNGADTFVFDDSYTIDHVHDFNIAEGDMLDISDLLIGYDPITDAINDFVSVTSDGVDTVIAVDSDGGGDSFIEVAILHGIADLTTENDLETSGNLITV